jgi:hypothetical protein
VGRARRDFNGGATVVDALATATQRRMADSAFAPLLHSGAYLVGVDFEHSWARRVWSLGGYLAGSHVTGSKEAIEATQGRPARYYGRPDAGHVELDRSRTSLGGHMGELALSRSGSWDGSVVLKQAPPSTRRTRTERGLRFRDPDFTFRSLRGNAVLRWEYRPGSTLFFVWQQDRASRIPIGDFDFGRDYGALFREPARNVFLVKAMYRFGK